MAATSPPEPTRRDVQITALWTAVTFLALVLFGFMISDLVYNSERHSMSAIDRGTLRDRQDRIAKALDRLEHEVGTHKGK